MKVNIEEVEFDSDIQNIVDNSNIQIVKNKKKKPLKKFKKDHHFEGDTK